LGYTIERPNSKEFAVQLRYPISRVSHAMAQKFGESIKYFIKNIPLTCTVKEACNKLNEFMKVNFPNV
jgi:hypothetical protein